MKSRKKAALLSLFLGSFGVHKFYLGDSGGGIFYIMLTIFGSNLGVPIGSILGFIDAFALFTMSDERFDKKYNSGPRAQKRDNRRNSRRSSRERDGASRTRNPYQNQNSRRATEARPRNPYQDAERRKPVMKDNPFKASGIKRLKDFELDLAEADLKRAIELSPGDATIHFSLGQLYSLNEDKEKSFYHLAKAVELGYKNVNNIKTADELAYLRVQPEFEAFQRSGYRSASTTANSASNNSNTEQSSNAAVTPPANDLLQDDLLLSQLNKLAELRKKGLLSEREFEEEKVKLMRR